MSRAVKWDFVFEMAKKKQQTAFASQHISHLKPLRIQ